MDLQKYNIIEINNQKIKFKKLFFNKQKTSVIKHLLCKIL